MKHLTISNNFHSILNRGDLGEINAFCTSIIFWESISCTQFFGMKSLQMLTIYENEMFNTVLFKLWQRMAEHPGKC